MHNIKIAIAVAMLFASPALAQPSGQTPETILKVNELSPPRVDHLGVRASALHWGMTAAEAARIMGTPAGVDSYSDDFNVRVLDFANEPIPTKVTIVNDTVSAVALDVARIGDELAEDESEHVVRVGMTAAQVRALYGAPQFAVNATFKGQPAEYAVFETGAAKSFGRFTFIGGVLTEFSVSEVSFSDVPWGA